jgi:integrase
MARIDLPYVQRFTDRHGKLRHYFRRPGRKTVSLPGNPGSDEFLTAYQNAVNSIRSTGAQGVEPGSIFALVAAYYQSPEWKALKPQTQKASRLILDKFRSEFGSGPAARFEEQHLRRILDKMSDRPWAAKNLLKRLRGVFKFALLRKLVRHDPTCGVRVATPKTDGFRAWTDGDIENFMAKWPVGSRARLALCLLLFTGQRRSDVVRMGRQHVRDGVIAVTQNKTGTQLAIPVHDVLKAELDAWPKENLTFLITATGRPFSPVGFSNWFATCAKEAGLPDHSSPHGLRKAAARWLAEAGCSAMEVAAITGHASLKEVERYTKSAAQGRLAVAAIGALAHIK